MAYWKRVAYCSWPPGAASTELNTLLERGPTTVRMLRGWLPPKALLNLSMSSSTCIGTYNSLRTMKRTPPGKVSACRRTLPSTRSRIGSLSSKVFAPGL